MKYRICAGLLGLALITSCSEDSLQRAPGKLKIVPSVVRFQNSDRYDEATVAVLNDGADAIVLQDLRITTNPDDVYVLADNLEGVTLQSGERAETTLAFAPKGGSFYRGALLATATNGKTADGNITSGAYNIPACQPPQTFEPVEVWSWTEEETGLANVLTTPIVANVTDDNGDGKIDTLDTPDILVRTVGGAGVEDVPQLRIIDGETGALHETVDLQHCPYFPASGLAAADLDADGTIEIVGVALYGNAPVLCAMRPDGSLVFRNETDPVRGGVQLVSRVSIADLRGNGEPKIIVGANVFHADGQRWWTGFLSGGKIAAGFASAVADLDGDGSMEVVAGSTAYTADGGVFWDHKAGLGEGLTAVGDCEGDGDLEVFFQASADPFHFSVIDTDGTLMVTSQSTGIPGVYLPSLPSAGDLDGDGGAEFVSVYQSRIVAYECDGSVLWERSVNDSSGANAAVIFDFEGDGPAEVVYGDEFTLHIYRGADGQEIFNAPRNSATSFESAAIADVNNDGHAEIVVPNSGRLVVPVTEPPNPGVVVYSNVNANWVAAPRIWSESGFRGSGISEMGIVRPASEQPASLPYRGTIALCETTE